jgi:hypothetical protein
MSLPPLNLRWSAYTPEERSEVRSRLELTGEGAFVTTEWVNEVVERYEQTLRCGEADRDRADNDVRYLCAILQQIRERTTDPTVQGWIAEALDEVGAETKPTEE